MFRLVFQTQNVQNAPKMRKNDIPWSPGLGPEVYKATIVTYVHVHVRRYMYLQATVVTYLQATETFKNIQ